MMSFSLLFSSMILIILYNLLVAPHSCMSSVCLMSILLFYPSIVNENRLWSIPLDYHYRVCISSLFYTSACCTSIQKRIFKACLWECSIKQCEKPYYRHHTGYLPLLFHSQSCRRKFERSDVICSCQVHAGCRSALSSARITLPFALAPMQLVSPLQLFCQHAEVPSTDKIFCCLWDAAIIPLICHLHTLSCICFSPPFFQIF